MMKWFHPCSLFLASLLACSEQRWQPPERQCPGELKPVWMADPNHSMCVVTSFRTRDLRTWTRARTGSSQDEITIQVDVSQTQLALTGGWPPRLDTLEKVPGTISHVDTVAGSIAYTAIGGDSAIKRFATGIQTTEGRYMVARGQSASIATVDTLLLMFRTVMRSPIPDPNRR